MSILGSILLWVAAISTPKLGLAALYEVRTVPPRNATEVLTFWQSDKRLILCVGWDEGILGSLSSAPMSLGEKATLTITPYVMRRWLFSFTTNVYPIYSDYGYGSR